MKRAERRCIVKELIALTDEQLESKYWELLYNDVLGSQAEAMAENGYEDVDVQERRDYEDWADEVTNIIEALLHSRGINVWEHYVHKS